MICPRSAILQSAAASSVAGIFEFTVSTAARIATFGRSTPNVRARSIAFWQMSTLSSSVGAMLIARVGHDQDLVVGRHVHQEHVTQAPAGAESRLLGDDRTQHFVRVQAALHQQLGLALTDQFHRLGRRRAAVGHVHDLAPPRSMPFAFAISAIVAAGPTRMGTIRPCVPASIAPDSAVSSQG